MKTENFKAMAPSLAATAAAFYLLPLLMQNTGAAMVIMLAAIPLVCFLAAAVLGYKKGVIWLYAPLVCLLFVPCVFLFYNSSAWVYALAYGLLALAGNLAGSGAARQNKSKKG